MQDAHAGGAVRGAQATPRNTVLLGAVANVDWTAVPVLYEYKLEGETAYKMKCPHDSFRPASEMIGVPNSNKTVAPVNHKSVVLVPPTEFHHKATL